jgi:regulator of protease activity HflC (stomatin/prohibitin superfamily)
MIGAITFILAILILGTIFGILNFSKYTITTQEQETDYRGNPTGRTYERTKTNTSQYVKLIVVFVVSALIAIINPISVERIDVGHVGLKINNTGDERGISKTAYVTGWVFYNSWLSRIKEYPVTQQHIDYEETAIITKGGFQAVIKPSFNWSVNPTNAADMYQNLKQDVDQIKDAWLKNAIIGAVNDVANLYTVDSIFNHRAEFESDIVKECNKRVSKWFNVSQLRTNIVPPKEITEAINAKTKAVQEAQAAIQQKIVAEAEALTQIARAKGDSAQAVIAAAGRAEAVKKEQQFLTPLYIDYLKVQKWKGDVPTTVLGGSSGFMINLNK